MSTPVITHPAVADSRESAAPGEDVAEFLADVARWLEPRQFERCLDHAVTAGHCTYLGVAAALRRRLGDRPA